MGNELGLLSKGILSYGDVRFDTESKGQDGFKRLRVIFYKRRVYIHYMWNGRVVNIVEV